jgi:hypothetical protein
MMKWRELNISAKDNFMSIKISEENTRYNQVLIEDEWRDVPLLGVKKGMIFRMFEADGTPVKHGLVDRFVATKDSWINDDGIVTVEYVWDEDETNKAKNS